MKNSYDIVVVGGGPSGSMAAWEAAKGGLSVCMLEKDRDIGYPVRCGEAAGESGLNKFVEIKDSWIAQKITGAKLGSPSGQLVNVDFASETGFHLQTIIFSSSVCIYTGKSTVTTFNVPPSRSGGTSQPK